MLNQQRNKMERNRIKIKCTKEKVYVFYNNELIRTISEPSESNIICGWYYEKELQISIKYESGKQYLYNLRNKDADWGFLGNTNEGNLLLTCYYADGKMVVKDYTPFFPDSE